MCAWWIAAIEIAGAEGLRWHWVGENRNGKRDAEGKSDPASGLAHGKMLVLRRTSPGTPGTVVRNQVQTPIESYGVIIQTTPQPMLPYMLHNPVPPSSAVP